MKKKNHIIARNNAVPVDSMQEMYVEDLVKFYFRNGFSNKEILGLLAHQHGVIISIRTLWIYSGGKKKQTDIQEIASFVQTEMATSGRLQGYWWLHLHAVRRGYVASQETMRMIIKEIDPEGVGEYNTNSDPKVIADYYISTVTHVGGCSKRLRADPGQERKMDTSKTCRFSCAGTTRTVMQEWKVSCMDAARQISA